jgi:hypothetical protein
MWSRLVACALLLLPAQSLAGAKEKVAALAPSGLMLVMDEKGNELVVQNADESFVPASVTKIVTAWLAMEVLGGDYRFKTRFYLDGDRVLYIRGGGDPFELGTSFANSAVAHPKFSAAFVGTLIKGLGVDHVIWGTDSVWYGSPQWQIEAMRRLEIPEDMQKKYGFAPLGGANSATKQMIFGANAARLNRINLKAAENTPMPAYSEDRLAKLKAEYELAAKEPSNLRYGYVRAA